MRHLALALAFVLAGCDRKAPDGYAFKQGEFTRLAPVVEIVLHPSTVDLQAAARKVGVDKPDVMAWSTMSAADPKGVCRIHIVDPAVRYAPQWLGHELTHCIYGRWHP